MRWRGTLTVVQACVLKNPPEQPTNTSVLILAPILTMLAHFSNTSIHYQIQKVVPE